MVTDNNDFFFSRNEYVLAKNLYLRSSDKKVDFIAHNCQMNFRLIVLKFW